VGGWLRMRRAQGHRVSEASGVIASVWVPLPSIVEALRRRFGEVARPSCYLVRQSWVAGLTVRVMSGLSPAWQGAAARRNSPGAALPP
jgi:hypothetical protein